MLCKVVPTTEEALTARLLQSTMQALELYGIYLGKELGLYTALKSGGQLTPPELAQAAGIAPRYAREWLEQQAVAGLLHVDATVASADARRYWLPAEHENVLADDNHPAHLAPLAQMVAGIGGALERVVAAYRTGKAWHIRTLVPPFVRARPGSTARRSSPISSRAGSPLRPISMPR